MYLVSRTREEEAKRILRDHEESLSRLIVAIITRGPKYERAIMAATVEGIRKDECVAIEDTSEGVKEAKQAGLCTIALPNEFTVGQDFGLADLVTDDLAKCIRW
jgi:beta-phosphoglucomutase-like phosphatase (HAD superfamily)